MSQNNKPQGDGPPVFSFEAGPDQAESPNEHPTQASVSPGVAQAPTAVPESAPQPTPEESPTPSKPPTTPAAPVESNSTNANWPSSPPTEQPDHGTSSPPAPDLTGTLRGAPQVAANPPPGSTAPVRSRGLLRAVVAIVAAFAVGALAFLGIRALLEEDEVPLLFLSDSGDLHVVSGSELPDNTTEVLDDVDDVSFIFTAVTDNSSSAGLQGASVVRAGDHVVVNARLEDDSGALLELPDDEDQPATVVLEQEGRLDVVVNGDTLSVGAGTECYFGSVDELRRGRLYRGDSCTVDITGAMVGVDQIGESHEFTVFSSTGEHLLTHRDELEEGLLVGTYFVTGEADGSLGFLNQAADRPSVVDVETGQVIFSSSDTSEPAPTLVTLDVLNGFVVKEGNEIHYFASDQRDYQTFELPDDGEGELTAVIGDQGLVMRYQDDEDITRVYRWDATETEPAELYSSSEQVVAMALLDPEVIIAVQFEDDDGFEILSLTETDARERVLATGDEFGSFLVVDDWLVIVDQLSEDNQERYLFVSRDGEESFESRYYDGLEWLRSEGQFGYAVGQDSPQVPLRIDFGRREATELEELDHVLTSTVFDGQFIVSGLQDDDAVTYSFEEDEFFPAAEVDDFIVIPSDFALPVVGR